MELQSLWNFISRLICFSLISWLKLFVIFAKILLNWLISVPIIFWCNFKAFTLIFTLVFIHFFCLLLILKNAHTQKYNFEIHFLYICPSSEKHHKNTILIGGSLKSLVWWTVISQQSSPMASLEHSELPLIALLYFWASSASFATAECPDGRRQQQSTPWDPRDRDGGRRGGRPPGRGPGQLSDDAGRGLDLAAVSWRHTTDSGGGF